MFKDISKFQLILLGAFVFFTMAGLLSFSFFQGSSGRNQVQLTVWGTMDYSAFDSFSEKVLRPVQDRFRVFYVQKNPATFDTNLVEALALGQGPDVILVSQKSMLKQRNKVSPIPYNTMPEVTFKSTFVEESELFLTQNGIMAMPFSIDPMVMYWNRDIFTNANISLPPKYWDEFLAIAPVLSKKDGASNITQSAVGMGEYINVLHAKDILSMIIIQAGNPIVVNSQNRYESTLSSSFNNTGKVANAALTFYTQFADPQKDVYSWNRALRPDDKFLFLAGKVGIYFGFASEYKELRDKNPNLNFDVTYVPQQRVNQGSNYVSKTFGNIYGFSVLRSSRNQAASYELISYLTSQQNLATWSQVSGLPAVRRDALSHRPDEASTAVFATSALWSRGWLDPDPQGTEVVFKNMIEGVTSGRLHFDEAISNASQQIQGLMRSGGN